MTLNVCDVRVQKTDGTETHLGQYNGQVLLIVNVASRCGFTKQYKDLQLLEDTYGPKGLKVLGFPCNDFGGQEPESLPKIKEFCTTTYQATFKLFDKVHAKGETTEPFTSLNKTSPVGLSPFVLTSINSPIFIGLFHLFFT